MNKFNEFLKAIKCSDFSKIFDILKDHSEYLMKDDEFGLKAIHWVCLINDKDLLNLLLKKNCDIETRGKNGWRPIHFAALMGHIKIAKFLIKKCCEVDCLTDNNETILDIVEGKSNNDFIDKIFKSINIKNSQTALDIDDSQSNLGFISNIFDKTINLKAGLEMGLRCKSSCEHKLCLTTILHGIEMGDKIGRGTFGKVYKIGDNENTFACKRMKNLKGTKLFKKKLKNNILPCLNDYLWPPMINHERIVTYYGSLEIENKILLIMEHMHKGSVEDIINSNELLSETKILQYTKDILQGLAFLHENNIIHRRVKPSHMLINGRDECKLSISLLSRLLVHENIEEEFDLKDVSPGTLNFMAPEIINGENYNLPVDIWSLGCSLINMLTGFPPYYQCHEYELCYLIGTIKKIEFEVNSSISNELEVLIKQMLSAEIKQRLLAKDLLMKPLFQFNNLSRTVSIDIINFNTDKEYCNKLIKYAYNNRQFAKLMGFTCGKDCNHKLCLLSVTTTKYKEDKLIGRGGFAPVHKVTESNTNRVFAIKCLKNDVNFDRRYVENNIDEFIKLINHDRIIKYYGTMESFTHSFIFMEYMARGSLKEEIENKGRIQLEETIKIYSQQILEGVEYLHSVKICHRDIKSDNILFNELGNIKIADFGFSRIFNSNSIISTKSYCGTLCYMSPEMDDKKYEFKTDIWSVGVTVYEMCKGSIPQNRDQLKKEYPKYLSKELKRFIDSMLQIDPNIRPSATELLLKSDFLNANHHKKKSIKRFFCIFKK